MDQRVWHAAYDETVSPSLRYAEETLPAFLERSVRERPNEPAIFFLGSRMSYAELGSEVRKFATALSKLGVKAGSRVAIHLPNLPQTVISYYAALALGAEVVLTNPLYTGPEVEHQWADSSCEVAITCDFSWDQTLRPIREQLHPKNYIICSIPEYLGFVLRLLAPLKLKREDPPKIAKVKREAGVHFFRELIANAGEDVPWAELKWDGIAVLQYTGGTTGPAKAAVLTHKNLSVNVQQVDAWFGSVKAPGEVILGCLPLFHVFGMTVAMNWAVYNGAAMVLLPNPRDRKQLIKSITKHKVTIFPGVPALFNALNNFPGIENAEVGSLKACFSGSAPIPEDVLNRFEQLTGARILEGFGLSETSPVTHVNPLDGERRLGTVGIPISDTDARIVDAETGKNDMPVGEEGELVIRGPQVMQGYWQRPEETANAIRDGWFYTGDLATMDAEGYFRIVGRKKDMINVGGLKVFPDEVDRVLMAHDHILEAATIGVPDPKRGETVKSFIVLQPGKSLSEEQIDAYCRENLAAYKVPRQIEYMDELPKSTVLKVLRRELRDRELAKLKDAAS